MRNKKKRISEKKVSVLSFFANELFIYVSMYECMYVWLYDCMNVWMYECMNEYFNGRLD